MERPGPGKSYPKEFKLKALEYYYDHDNNLAKSAEELDIAYDTLRTWVYSQWGKLYLAELHVKKCGTVVTAGMASLIDAKVSHLQSQFKYFGELEVLMQKCIDQYKDLIPNSTKLQDVNDSFKVIADTYLKAMQITMNANNENPHNNQDDVRNFVVNIIDKQLVTRSQPVQDLLTKTENRRK